MAKEWLIVEPAYFVTYLTNEAMRADWNAGKDFKIVDGPYMSKRDIDKNTMDVRNRFAGVQIVQKRRGTIAPYLTEEITW